MIVRSEIVFWQLMETGKKPEISESTLVRHKEQEVKKWTVRFEGRLEATLMNYGATLMELHLPDADGKLANVVLGYDHLHDYQEDDRYFGATVGRYANRIANGKFTLNGHTCSLPINNSPNTLHGGPDGFDKQVWHLDDIQTSDTEASLCFTYTSPDGEQGFPGRLTLNVTYVFTPDSMHIRYEATTDKATVINPTHHSYFNLSGKPGSSITDHVLMLNAFGYLPIDPTGIPLSGVSEVRGTPFDFTGPKRIGEDIGHKDLQRTNGYDHCWVLDEPTIDKVCARLSDPASGRMVEIYTSEPGIQFFSGNFPPPEELNEGGRHYIRYSGLALETQHFPDSPNRPNFPSTILSPGEVFHSQTLYRFLIR